MAEKKGTTKTTDTKKATGGKTTSTRKSATTAAKKMSKRQEAIARAKAEGFEDMYEETDGQDVDEEYNEPEYIEEEEYDETEAVEEEEYDETEAVEEEEYDETEVVEEEEYDEAEAGSVDEEEYDETFYNTRSSAKPSSRSSRITRKTAETDIKISFNIDGSGKYRINTGIGFFDHMLNSFTKHGLFDMELVCNGDLYVDTHHSIEDVGIVVGTAIKEAVGNKKGIRRYASEILPMDDALVLCALDLSGRPYLSFDASFKTEKVGYMDTCMVREFFYAVSYSAGMNLHLKVLDGINDHHIIEAMFKAFAKALDTATGYDPRIKDVLSTKGSL